MSKVLNISPDLISLDSIFEYFRSDFNVSLSEECLEAVAKSRTYLESKLSQSDKLIYGINTGFGSLCNVEITTSEIEALQYNLIVSHACGQGDLVPQDIARLILLLKIKNMSYGYSGVRLALLKKLVSFYNQDITPVIFQQGSLGASGDLAPLAHMSLPLLGLGEVYYKGERQETEKLFESLNILPISLSAKEGLALINGTQFSLAYSLWSVYHGKRIMRWSNIIAAISLEAFVCSLDPFDSSLHKIRRQEGQQRVAVDILKILQGSEIIGDQLLSVQDPYSFRCVPQVHGASNDALDYVSTIVERELNAVTDNPNVFAMEDKILSGGNFHAQPLALSLDFLCIALAELGSVSERRTYKLINGERGLPDYLTPHPGLHSGFMIPQYTAASIVSQNKQLCTPSSVDSIVSSKGQEDHVSMAANGATKTYRVVNNIYKLLSIELMVATQALEFRKPKKSSPFISKVVQAYRQVVPKLEKDRVLSNDINTTRKFILESDY
ncbi:MAG: histidine ammonia-lyase [Saprospiraceae bacterium]|nr:histidine ammonia-lyase [Bacteroidia bacterium]NNL93795.1 histidine ammonia-lyase [Saprospiraceae bacterium]